jgi:uncharacterized protein (TIGR02996 family)
MSRPELLAFLEDIKENPADDTPRLVLADWLEEHGDRRDASRAELIRVQCRLERLAARDPDREALRFREQQLVSEHEAEWMGPLADRGRSPSWKRGLGRIELAAGDFLKREPKARPSWRELERTEEYAFLDGLSLTDLHAGDLPSLLASDRLATFTALRLVACNLGPEGAALLAECPRLGRLHELEVGDNQIGPQGMRALASSRHLGRLEVLNLWANALEVEGIEVLAASRLLRRLRRLSVAYNALGPVGMEVLAPHTGGLEHLEVWSNDIGRRGLRALLDAPLTPRLRELDLPWNALRDEGAELLAGSPKAARVKELFLFCNQIQDSGARALADSPHLAGLEVLDLDANRIGERGALALARSPFLHNIRLLSLAKNDLGAAARQALEQRFGERVHLKEG